MATAPKYKNIGWTVLTLFFIVLAGIGAWCVAVAILVRLFYAQPQPTGEIGTATSTAIQYSYIYAIPNSSKLEIGFCGTDINGCLDYLYTRNYGPYTSIITPPPSPSPTP
jgi:hypothetical protein